jgi:hypothetical protein
LRRSGPGSGWRAGLCGVCVGSSEFFWFTEPPNPGDGLLDVGHQFVVRQSQDEIAGVLQFVIPAPNQRELVRGGMPVESVDFHHYFSGWSDIIENIIILKDGGHLVIARKESAEQGVALQAIPEELFAQAVGMGPAEDRSEFQPRLVRRSAGLPGPVPGRCGQAGVWRGGDVGRLGLVHGDFAKADAITPRVAERLRDEHQNRLRQFLASHSADLASESKPGESVCCSPTASTSRLLRSPRARESCRASTSGLKVRAPGAIGLRGRRRRHA